MKFVSWFAGIGGADLGLERAGWECVGQVEIDPFCRAVLTKHWPKVPKLEDVRTVRGDEFGPFDFLVAGFPCQDVSNAGLRAGISAPRSGLYGQVVRCLRVVRPLGALLENVAALLGRGMGTVLGDLAEIGYDTEWDCVPASAVGAPHQRDRIFIVANRQSAGEQRLVSWADIGSSGQWLWGGEKDLQLIAHAPHERTDRWPEPIVCRVDDGIPGRVDRIESLGNAIVPQVAEVVGRAINKAVEPTPPPRAKWAGIGEAWRSEK